MCSVSASNIQKIAALREKKQYVIESEGTVAPRYVWGLNQLLEERAMIIKDKEGDWCIVVAHWSGFRRYIQPAFQSSNDEPLHSTTVLIDAPTCQIRGSGGHLALRIWWPSSKTSTVNFTQVPDTINSYTVVLNDSTFNLQTGEIIISKNCEEIAQHVCLAFCCGILHVLCQPRLLVLEKQTNSRARKDYINMAQGKLFSSSETASMVDRLPVNAKTTTERQNVSQRQDQLMTEAASLYPARLEWVMDPVPNLLFEMGGEVIGKVNICCVQDVRSDESVGCPREIFRDLTLHGFLGTLKNLEDKPTIKQTSSDGLINKLRVPASMGFVLCQAAGFPVDSLIPSIQYTRYLKRLRLKNSTKQITDNNQPPAEVTTVKEPCACVFHCADNMFYSNVPRSNLSQTLDTPWTNCSLSLEDRQSTFSTTAAPQPYSDWPLKDVYDYFVFNLPGICSGCVNGCQFCRGLQTI